MFDLDLDLASAAAVGGGASFAPLSTSPTAWWDPSDISTLYQTNDTSTPVTAAGQTVGRISDKSGNGHHLTQATLGNRPTYQIDSGGRPYLLFDGVDDYLVIATTAGLSFPYDRISAVRQNAYTVGKRLWGFTGTFVNQRLASPEININDGTTDVVKNAGLAIGANGVITERHISAAQQLAINNGAYVTGNAGANAPAGSFAIGASTVGTVAASIRLYGQVAKAGGFTDAQIAQWRTHMGA